MNDKPAISLQTGDEIPLTALEYTTSRSGGPGGQNVNKVETKVTVRLQITGSQWLAVATQERILARLPSKIDTGGGIRVASSTERTQLGNKTAAVARLERMLNNALQPEKKRYRTKPSRAAVQRRVEQKKQQGEKKARRRWRPGD